MTAAYSTNVMQPMTMNSLNGDCCSVFWRVSGDTLEVMALIYDRDARAALIQQPDRLGSIKSERKICR